MAEANAANLGGQAGEQNAEEEMEVVPPQLDPVQLGNIIMQMQHTITQLRGEIDAGQNRQLLGVQPAALPQPEQPAPALPDEADRRRLDQLLKILRSAPKFHGGTHEPWRCFELRFNAWRSLSRLDAYATEHDKKVALLTCMEGSASRAMELHGQDSTAFRHSATLDNYLVYIKNVFSPAAEKDCARAAFKQRLQKQNEPPSIYFSEKLSLYLQTLNGAAFDYEQFKEELYMGLRSKYLRGRMIESPATNDRELYDDLMRATAQGQAMFKASCPEIVSLDGLAVTTQFSKDAENEVDMESIEGLGDRKCYKCQKTGHIAKECKSKRKEGTERKEGNCNYCGIRGHWARDCFKKKKDQANGGIKKNEKTKKEQRRGGNIKAAGSDEDEEQLALEYEDEAEDISRLRGRVRRRSSEYPKEKTGFQNRSARQWH